MYVLVPKSCLTLCDPMDCSPPGSSVHGILQQEYWNRLPCPLPGDFLHPGMEPGSPTLQADSLSSERPAKPVGDIPIQKHSMGQRLDLQEDHRQWFLLSQKGMKFHST